MTTTLRTLSAFSLLATAPLQAQTFDLSRVEFWVGTGTDSSVLVVDFQDGSFDPSHAWGFLHDGTATGEDMLNAIAAADVNISVDITGGFLNSITYNTHEGIGASPDYWSTWSGTGIADLEMNMGIGEELGNGSWFGCSYTDFEPALSPTEPQAAFDPFRFTAEDVDLWVGTGANSAVLVLDFQDGATVHSYAWGYHFDGVTTGEAMLTAIAEADPALAVAIGGGFLNDISYGEHAGIGGAPDYWSTWSGTNLGNWSMNMGIATEVGDGGLFGCSYTDFGPALRPYYPIPATINSGINEQVVADLLVYPQPAAGTLSIQRTSGDVLPVRITDLAGHVVFTGRTDGMLTTLDVHALAAGMYVLQVSGTQRTIAVQ
ncbi:MAG TPA: T9SS type A sorting domain-containing protein [Flavobacteriales bacterium]